MATPGDGAPPRGAARETWIAVVRPLGAGDRVALAWVRHRDEWLAEAGIARRGDELDELARMYQEAVTKRGHGPDRLAVRDAAHADALRARIGAEVVIEIGFDARARELDEAAAHAVELIFGAEVVVGGADGDQAAGATVDLAAAAYDPDRTPAPAAWLALSQDERQRQVRLAHVSLGEPMPDHELQLHAGMHEAVETQIAAGDPREAAAALARLEGAGLGRHHAIHLIARVLMRKMSQVLTTGQAFDAGAYRAELRDLARGRDPA